MLCTGISQMSATTTKSTIYTSNRNPYNITQFQSGIGGWCYTCTIMQVDIVQLCFVLFRQQCLLRKYVQLPSVIPAIVYSGQCKQLHFHKENNEIAINDYCRIGFFWVMDIYTRSCVHRKFDKQYDILDFVVCGYNYFPKSVSRKKAYAYYHRIRLEQTWT